MRTRPVRANPPPSRMISMPTRFWAAPSLPIRSVRLSSHLPVRRARTKVNSDRGAEPRILVSTRGSRRVRETTTCLPRSVSSRSPYSCENSRRARSSAAARPPRRDPRHPSEYAAASRRDLTTSSADHSEGLHESGDRLGDSRHARARPRWRPRPDHGGARDHRRSTRADELSSPVLHVTTPSRLYRQSTVAAPPPDPHQASFLG